MKTKFDLPRKSDLFVTPFSLLGHEFITTTKSDFDDRS